MCTSIGDICNSVNKCEKARHRYEHWLIFTNNNNDMAYPLPFCSVVNMVQRIHEYLEDRWLPEHGGLQMYCTCVGQSME